MFVYGVCIGSEEKYDKWAHASIDRHVSDACIVERRQQTSIFAAYNSILTEIGERRSEIEGVILVHEDVELLHSPEAHLRAEFGDSTVGIVGAIGGQGVRSVRWSRSEVLRGKAPDAFYGANDFGGGAHSVDIVDGLFLALSPWVAANLRFDEDRYEGFHAYDADICMQALAAGVKVRVADFELFHHTKGGFGDVSAHRQNDDAFRKKWGIARDPWAHRLAARIKGRVY
jgi:hypothetical protein